jgi:hypothetical protein
MTTFKRHLEAAAQQMEPRLQLAVEHGKRAPDLHAVRFAHTSRYEQWAHALRGAASSTTLEVAHVRLWRSRREDSQTSVPLRCELVAAKRSH